MFYVKMYDYFSPIISAQHITITISTADKEQIALC